MKINYTVGDWESDYKIEIHWKASDEAEKQKRLQHKRWLKKYETKYTHAYCPPIMEDRIKFIDDDLEY
jgi:hypothetical protein